MDGAFLLLAGLLLGISIWLRPREIPQSSPASPQKTPSIPPLLLGLTQSALGAIGSIAFPSIQNKGKIISLPFTEDEFTRSPSVALSPVQ